MSDICPKCGCEMDEMNPACPGCLSVSDPEHPMAGGTPMRYWDRVRFKVKDEDYRPVIFPPPGPYWCSGSGDGHWWLVAYMPAPFNQAEFLKYWPGTDEIEFTHKDTRLTYSDRFPKPEWWKD